MPPPEPRITVTGSIAVDHLMHFPGRFADQLIADKLGQVSLSFLVDDLIVRRGGVAANIAVGLARLGLRPTLIGAAGVDFDGYRTWLRDLGVDCDHILTSTTAHTARFVCTTDADQCQIASFYPGAMAEAARVDLRDHAAVSGPPDLVLIGPDTPEAMLRHAGVCRAEGWRFVADPSQQLALMDGGQILAFVDGCDYLTVNEYELSLLLAKTGLTVDGLLRRAATVVTTLGADGVRLHGRGAAPVTVPACVVPHVADPTGVGDAFRAGFFAGCGWGLSEPDAATVGCQLAARVIATHGTQEYDLDRHEFLAELAGNYGTAVADRVEAAWTAAYQRELLEHG
jgi:adenosine kinase